MFKLRELLCSSRESCCVQVEGFEGVEVERVVVFKLKDLKVLWLKC